MCIYDTYIFIVIGADRDKAVVILMGDSLNTLTPVANCHLRASLLLITWVLQNKKPQLKAFTSW